MQQGIVKKWLLFTGLFLLVSLCFSCLKDNTAQPTRENPPESPIIGKWSLISDSVGITGNYTVNGGIPVTGLLPAGSNDYFEFDTNGQFHEMLNGMVYPYPCVYQFRRDSVLLTNNVYAPLDSAKTVVTAHTLRIVGKNASSTGSIISIFSLRR